RLGALQHTSSGVSGGLSFDQAKVDATDPGRLACTKDVRKTGSLDVIGYDRPAGNIGAQQCAKLHVWNETKATCEIVAFNLPEFFSRLKREGFQRPVTS